MSAGPRQIVLVGLSGVGKSSTGAILAERLGWPLIDTDDLVTEAEGRTPAELITSLGEPEFRTLEERVVAEAAQRAPAVIATGGGAFLSARSRRALGEQGLLCWLDATPVEIARRLRSAPNASERPLLAGDLDRRLQELDEERRVYYAHADVWIPDARPRAERRGQPHPAGLGRRCERLRRRRAPPRPAQRRASGPGARGDRRHRRRPLPDLGRARRARACRGPAAPARSRGHRPHGRRRAGHGDARPEPDRSPRRRRLTRGLVRRPGRRADQAPARRRGALPLARWGACGARRYRPRVRRRSGRRPRRPRGGNLPCEGSRSCRCRPPCSR